MNVDRVWRIGAVALLGALGTALIIHACGIHFHSQARAMATGDILVWFAFALAVTR